MDKITSILTGALTIAAGYVIASLVVSKMSATPDAAPKPDASSMMK
jgi:hypothetical protein